MNYALIGCGRIAGNHITAALDNGLNIVAVCDIVKEKALDIVDRFSLDESYETKCYTDYKKLIDENKLDLVAVATDSDKHAAIALYAIEHGINVIIEKPIAMSIDDADRIIEEMKKHRVKVCANHQNRFNIAIQQLKNAIDDGRLGKLSHGAIAVRWSRDERYYGQADWRGKWASDGGTLMNQCIHGIDLLRWLFGDDIREVYGALERRFHESCMEAEDVGMAVVRFQSGAVATVEGTVNAYKDDLEETLYVFGERGNVKIGGSCANKIELWQLHDKTTDDNNSGFCEQTKNVYGNGHTSLYFDMIHAIEEDREPYVDAYAGKRALELVLAIYKSQKEGCPVTLPLGKFTTSDMQGQF